MPLKSKSEKNWEINHNVEKAQRNTGAVVWSNQPADAPPIILSFMTGHWSKKTWKNSQWKWQKAQTLAFETNCLTLYSNDIISLK